MTVPRRAQLVAFSVTWIVYASSYLLRKPLGVIKGDLQSIHGFSRSALGWLDSCYLLPYAVVAMMFGNLGDKYGCRLILTISMFTIGVSMISFGFWDSPYMYGILLFINGSAQATLWGNCVKSLSGWYNSDQKATIFGIWGTCTFAGGIIGTAMAVQLQKIYPGDFRMIFMVPSVWVMMVGVLVHFMLRTPEELGVENAAKSALPKHVTEGETRQLNFFQTWRLKMVPELAWTMFGMKLVRYCLYMWLPMYLNQNLNYDKVHAGMFSTTFEIGGVLGSACIGVFIDKLFKGRTYFGVFVALIGSSASLCLFQITSTWGVFFNFIFLFTAGACSSGPDSVVSGALASEVGARENAQAAVSGVVNGFGSLGTVIEGPFIAFILTYFGWGGTFYAMVLLTLISAAAIGKAAFDHTPPPMNDSI